MGEQVGDARYVFTINCSGGTYIRSIVRDIAKSLGVCGVMTKLTRTRSGFFTIDNAVPIDDLTEETDLNKFVIKPQDVIDLPDLVLEKSAAKRLIDGLKDEFAFADGLYKVYNEDEFWGIGEVDGGVIKMKAFIRDI